MSARRRNVYHENPSVDIALVGIADITGYDDYTICVLLLNDVALGLSWRQT